jgi:hypothetical protein
MQMTTKPYSQMQDDELSELRWDIHYQIEGFEVVINDPTMPELLKGIAKQKIGEFRFEMKEVEAVMIARGDEPYPFED